MQGRYRLAGDALVRRLAASASAIPGLREALLHEPASASDPCLETEAPPTLVAELHFDNLLALEAAATAGARWRAGWTRVSTPGSGRRTSATVP
ncbi:hypothetical protein WJ970_04370 [Achromobacter xylosoxidans]